MESMHSVGLCECWFCDECMSRFGVAGVDMRWSVYQCMIVYRGDDVMCDACRLT